MNISKVSIHKYEESQKVVPMNKHTNVKKQKKWWDQTRPNFGGPGTKLGTFK